MSERKRLRQKLRGLKKKRKLKPARQTDGVGVVVQTTQRKGNGNGGS